MNEQTFAKESWNGGQTGLLIEFLKSTNITLFRSLTSFSFHTELMTICTPGWVDKVRPYYLNNQTYGKNSKSRPEDIVPIHSLPLNHCTLINITVSDVSLNSKASAITRLRV